MPTPYGSSPSSTVAVTGNNWIDGLLSLAKWGSEAAGNGTILTYSFPDLSAIWRRGYGVGEPGYAGKAALSAEQQADTRLALQTWANVANVTFQEVPDTSVSVGDLRITTASLKNAAAWAYSPSGSAIGAPEDGDVWLDPYSENTTPTPGSYGFMTLVHEIGHALGLKHPFDTDGSHVLWARANDVIANSLMSYSMLPGDQNSTTSRSPTTPMYADILAIQYLYGANHSYNSGDTVYHFDQGSPYWQTIWDGGGTDTLSYAGNTSNAVLDLRAGHWNQVGTPIVFTSGMGIATNQRNTVMIAAGANIENATGGQGNDRIIGNDLNNGLLGNGGNDTLTGGAGNDRLDGEAGSNTLYGGGGNDTFVVSGMTDTVVEAVGSGRDLVLSSGSFLLLANVEDLTLTGTANINGSGNGLANVLTGNAGTNILSGGGGGDILIAGSGAATLRGGGGNDTFVVNSVADTVVEVAGYGMDLVKSSVSYTLPANVESLTLTGSDNINGTGNALKNVITGNGGDNTLDGLGGNDVLVGGGGADRFEFATALNALNNMDIIQDFVAGVDVMDLYAHLFTALGAPGALPSQYFVSAAGCLTAQDPNQHILYNATTGDLYYDADGNGTVAAIRFADLTNHPALSATDFHIV